MHEKKNELLKKLKILEEEHRDLDEIINRLYDQKTVNFLQLKRLKKRKLLIRDKIKDIRDNLEPDIIA